MKIEHSYQTVVIISGSLIHTTYILFNSDLQEALKKVNNDNNKTYFEFYIEVYGNKQERFNSSHFINRKIVIVFKCLSKGPNYYMMVKIWSQVFRFWIQPLCCILSVTWNGVSLFFLWFAALCIVSLGSRLWKARLGKEGFVFKWNTVMKKIEPNHLSLLSELEGRLFSYFSAKHSQLLWTVGEGKKNVGFTIWLSTFWKDFKRVLFIKYCKGMKTLPATKIDGWSKTGTDPFGQEFLVW